MWDEKKFFEDFAKEADQVKPDAEFVNNLKEKVSKEASVRNHTSWGRYGAVAAALLLCIIGVFTWKQGIIPEKSEAQMQSGLQAGKEDEPNADSSTIITLNTAKECLTDEDTLVTDENGNPIDEEKRTELIGLLEHAVSTEEEPDEDTGYREYHCSGTSEFTLIVYDNGCFKINETGIMYKN